MTIFSLQIDIFERNQCDLSETKQHKNRYNSHLARHDPLRSSPSILKSSTQMKITDDDEFISQNMHLVEHDALEKIQHTHAACPLLAVSHLCGWEPAENLRP